MKARKSPMSAPFEALNAPKNEMNDFGLPAYFQSKGPLPGCGFPRIVKG